MKKIALLAGTALAIAVGTLTAVAQEKTKACWIYVGPIGDFGWSYQHDQGRQAVEKEFVLRALKRHNGNITRAAAELDVSRPTLYELMEKLGVPRE